MGRLKGGYTRGLATVLLVITLTAVSAIPVQAITVDDLRAYLGKTVEKRKPTMIKVPGYTDGQSEKDSGAVNSNSSAEELGQLKLNIAKLESRYEQGLQGNTEAVKLIALMKSIRDTKSKADEQEKISGLISKLDIDTLINNSIASEFEMKTGSKFGTYSFSIGDVGNMAVSPSEKFLSLVTPYGYKINPDGTHEKKNTSIDLEIPAGSNVLSQWNGKVAYIEEDEIGKYSTVTLFHGQRLYTVYHHIVAGEIYVGKSVSQGDIIGTAGATKTAEQSKNNHINYQVILDDDYVNPLLLFGKRSQPMYEDWLKRSYETYTVEVGEEFYYADSLRKSNPNNEESKQNTIEGAIEPVGEYVKPDPGVVK